MSALWARLPVQMHVRKMHLRQNNVQSRLTVKWSPAGARPRQAGRAGPHPATLLPVQPGRQVAGPLPPTGTQEPRLPAQSWLRGE